MAAEFPELTWREEETNYSLATAPVHLSLSFCLLPTWILGLGLVSSQNSWFVGPTNLSRGLSPIHPPMPMCALRNSKQPVRTRNPMDEGNEL